MQAKKLNINDYRPVLTDNSIDVIYKSIMAEVENLKTGDGLVTIERECLNGIKVDVELSSEGFDYRNIELGHVYVTYGDLIAMEDYEEALSNMFSESIEKLNAAEEQYYYSMKGEFAL